MKDELTKCTVDRGREKGILDNGLKQDRIYEILGAERRPACLEGSEQGRE